MRRAIAAKLHRENGIDVDPMREVIVTTGGQEALFLIMAAIIDPGDEILVPDPRYTSYDVAIVMIFKDESSLRNYEKSPIHQKAVKETLQPLVAKFVVYDFTDDTRRLAH